MVIACSTPTRPIPAGWISSSTILVTIRIKKHELAECLRRMPQHGTIHDSLYNAFSFGLFAAYELESEDRELLQKLISEWRSQYRRPNDSPDREERRGTDRRVLRHERAAMIQEKSTYVFSF